MEEASTGWRGPGAACTTRSLSRVPIKQGRRFRSKPSLLLCTCSRSETLKKFQTKNWTTSTVSLTLLQKLNTGISEIRNRGFLVKHLAFICRATNYFVQCYMRTPPVSQTVYYFEMKLGPLISAKNPGGTCFEAGRGRVAFSVPSWLWYT